MTRPLPRTGFNSPRLIRLLADLATEDVVESKQSFAERLGQWLDLSDAIALSGALHASAGSSSAPEAGSRANDALPDEAQALARVRTILADSITADGVLKPGKVRVRLPLPAAGTDAATVDFTPYRRYYFAHQRDMESSIGPLRTTVRQALATRSPALRQLAALDAVLGKALDERERTLLATVPNLLEQRFERLRAAHRQRLADTQQADEPAQWLQPGGWLAGFCRDMQGVLLAELDVRLQPVMGMIEASSNEVTKSQ